MWSLMQWWSNPSARSHLEAWVNIWVRSAGSALVLAGWLLVGAVEGGRAFWYRNAFLFSSSFSFLLCACVCVQESKAAINPVQSVPRESSIGDTVSLRCFDKHAPDHFCNYFVDIKSGIRAPSRFFIFIFFLIDILISTLVFMAGLCSGPGRSH